MRACYLRGLTARFTRATAFLRPRSLGSARFATTAVIGTLFPGRSFGGLRRSGGGRGKVSTVDRLAPRRRNDESLDSTGGDLGGCSFARRDALRTPGRRAIQRSGVVPDRIWDRHGRQPDDYAARRLLSASQHKVTSTFSSNLALELPSPTGGQVSALTSRAALQRRRGPRPRLSLSSPCSGVPPCNTPDCAWLTAEWLRGQVHGGEKEPPSSFTSGC